MLSRHAHASSKSCSFYRLAVQLRSSCRNNKSRAIATLRCYQHPSTARTVRPDVEDAVAISRRYHQLLTSTTPHDIKLTDSASRGLSDLGLRSELPPDSLPDPNDETPPEVPDQEWEIRTGRAIFVIRETLPEFFKTGLITSVNKATGTPRTPPSAFTPTANVNFLEHHIINEDEEAIYSPNVRLSYTPPIALPPPFPKTFHVEGLQLYVASSSLIRHTMNALYSDLKVQITKLVVNTPVSLSSTSDSSKKRRISREKSFVLRQIVTGTARVSGKPSQWEIESTYTFSPLTGLIHLHIVNSIHPAPHVAVYDSLRNSLEKILGTGLGWRGGAGTTGTGAATYKGKVQEGKSG